jgi:hypothetical protein
MEGAKSAKEDKVVPTSTQKTTTVSNPITDAIERNAARKLIPFEADWSVEQKINAIKKSDPELTIEKQFIEIASIDKNPEVCIAALERIFLDTQAMVKIALSNKDEKVRQAALIRACSSIPIKKKTAVKSLVQLGFMTHEQAQFKADADFRKDEDELDKAFSQCEFSDVREAYRSIKNSQVDFRPESGSSGKGMTGSKKKTGKGFAITSFIFGLIMVLSSIMVMAHEFSWNLQNDDEISVFHMLPALIIYLGLSVTFGFISYKKGKRK